MMLLQLFDFAALETGGAVDLTGEAPGDNFSIGAEQVLNPEHIGDRARDEAVGGGDDDQFAPGFAMLVEKSACARGNHRLNHSADEFGAPGLELCHLELAQAAEAEASECADIQLAGLVDRGPVGFL